MIKYHCMDMKKIILASSNAHKIKEFRDMLKDLNIEILSLKDVGFYQEIPETGTTFKENSYIKARTIFDKYHLPVIADDSGLSVDILNGGPGVYSHRFSGENATDKENRTKMISELEKHNVNSSKAHFTCVITYIDEVKMIVTEGFLYGEIIKEERGDNGFGYDPIFYLREYNKTVAELPESEKNKISHRHNALIELKDELKK